MSLIIILTILATFESATATLRVIGGKNVKENEFPYQVSIHWRGTGHFRHFCGGALISPTWVLTAARCKTEEPIPGQYEVKAGMRKLSEVTEENSRRVVEIIVHPNYRG